jgi:hypothetical protein
MILQQYFLKLFCYEADKTCNRSTKEIGDLSGESFREGGDFLGRLLFDISKRQPNFLTAMGFL